MTDIQKWLLQLQSDNPNKRYEACEELRVAPSITDEALAALRKVTSDPNTGVAEAAQRALDVHTIQLNQFMPSEDAFVRPQYTAKEKLIYFGASFVIGFLIAPIINLLMGDIFNKTLTMSIIGSILAMAATLLFLNFARQRSIASNVGIVVVISVISGSVPLLAFLCLFLWVYSQHP